MSSDHSRRVATEQEGFDLIADLGEDEFDAEVIGGARTCSCRTARTGPAHGSTINPVNSHQETGSQTKKREEPIVLLDWKQRQAGEHE